MTEVVEPQATPDPATNPWVPMWSLNPTGVDFRYQGDYLPGSYTDGDIVVFQGVAYLCVRPTGNAPVPWTPPQQVPTYGTTLPATPVDGQEHVLVDSVTNPSYQWRFRYNAGSTSAYKWEYVGGAPMLGISATQQSWASPLNTYQNIVGTPLQLVRAGDYRVAGTCTTTHPSAGATNWAAIYVNTATNIAGIDAQMGFPNAGGYGGMLVVAPQKVTVAANATVGMAGKINTANGAFYNMGWEVQPIRVS